MIGLSRVTAWTLAVMCIAAVPAQAQKASPVDGTWRLVTYKGGGNEGPASGQLIFDRGRFSYVYTMNEDRPKPDGRAHGGTYRIEGADTLVFVLNWDVHYVNGAGTINRKPSESTTKMTLKGNQLTITFPNGAFQTLERVAP